VVNFFYPRTEIPFLDSPSLGAESVHEVAYQLTHHALTAKVVKLGSPLATPSASVRLLPASFCLGSVDVSAESSSDRI